MTRSSGERLGARRVLAASSPRCGTMIRVVVTGGAYRDRGDWSQSGRLGERQQAGGERRAIVVGAHDRWAGRRRPSPAPRSRAQAPHRPRRRTKRSTRPAYSRATPRALDSWPSDVSIRSAGPLSARPPMIGLTATFGSPGGDQRITHARQLQDRADADDRVGGADDDQLGVADGVEHLGGRPRASTPSR